MTNTTNRQKKGGPHMLPFDFDDSNPMNQCPESDDCDTCPTEKCLEEDCTKEE